MKNCRQKDPKQAFAGSIKSFLIFLAITIFVSWRGIGPGTRWMFLAVVIWGISLAFQYWTLRQETAKQNNGHLESGDRTTSHQEGAEQRKEKMPKWQDKDLV